MNKILVKKNLSVQLVEMIGSSSQNMYNKMKRDNFSEKELLEIAYVLDCKYEGLFTLDPGETI
jgi:hypothetical protein